MSNTPGWKFPVGTWVYYGNYRCRIEAQYGARGLYYVYCPGNNRYGYVWENELSCISRGLHIQLVLTAVSLSLSITLFILVLLQAGVL